MENAIRYRKHLVPIGLFFIVSATILIRLLMQLRSPFACGIDGYYYALQMKSLFASGAFAIPDSSPVLYLLSGLCAPFADPVLPLKIGAALLGALPVIPAFLIGRRINGTSGGFLCALLTSASVSISYLSIELFKNLGALSFLLFFICYCLKVESGDHSRTTVASALLFGLLALLSHRTTAVITTVLAGSLLFKTVKISPKRKFLIATVAMAGAAGLLLLMRGIHPSDMARFKGAFSPIPGLPILSDKLRFLFPKTLLWELSLAAVIPWGLIFLRKEITSTTIRTLWLTLFLLLLPFWKMENAGMGFRLALVGAPLAFLITALLLHRRLKKPAILRKAVIILLLAVVFLPKSAYRPWTDPPYARYERLLPFIKIPPGSILICHRGLNLYYSYMTENEGLSYIPDFPVKKEKLWRLTAYVNYPAMARTIPANERGKLIRQLPHPYALIREDRWQNFLNRLQPADRKLHHNSYNPYKKKPWFLRKQQGR